MWADGPHVYMFLVQSALIYLLTSNPTCHELIQIDYIDFNFYSIKVKLILNCWIPLISNVMCHIFEKYSQFSAYIIQMLRYDGCLLLYLTPLIINISFFPKNWKMKYTRGLGQWQFWLTLQRMLVAECFFLMQLLPMLQQISGAHHDIFCGYFGEILADNYSKHFMKFSTIRNNNFINYRLFIDDIPSLS